MRAGCRLDEAWTRVGRRFYEGCTRVGLGLDADWMRVGRRLDESHKVSHRHTECGHHPLFSSITPPSVYLFIISF